MSSNSKWSIEKGDYKRDEESTWSYFRKKQRRKNIKLAFIILLYALGVSSLTYLLITII